MALSITQLSNLKPSTFNTSPKPTLHPVLLTASAPYLLMPPVLLRSIVIQEVVSSWILSLTTPHTSLLH